jgi:hypothetical protein
MGRFELEIGAGGPGGSRTPRAFAAVLQLDGVVVRRGKPLARDRRTRGDDRGKATLRPASWCPSTAAATSSATRMQPDGYPPGGASVSGPTRF